ncbi:MAG: DNA polymerase III subunit delta [Lachnospiraceae bacterium]|nr:DNA polymerase III subunit delta [Lachnospiraceae bacterium]
MQVLKQDIKSNEYKRIYLLFGEEQFLVNSYKKQLRNAITGDDTINFSLYEGKDILQHDIIQSADTMPFFADRRLVMVEDSGFFKKEAGELLEYLPDIPETTTIVFAESQVDKRNKLYKKVKELGHVAEFARQSEAELKKWIVRYLAGNDKKITSQALMLLVDMAGDDMENILHELEKLTAYVGDRAEIYPEDVENICTKQIVSRIFDMTNAVAAGNQNEALRLYYDLLANREPAMRILRLISNQFAQLLEAKDLKEKGLGKGEIAAKMGKSPYIAGKISEQAGRFKKSELVKIVELCAASEESIKKGLVSDNIATELLIIESSKRQQ